MIIEFLNKKRFHLGITMPWNKGAPGKTIKKHLKNNKLRINLPLESVYL
jgi:hypothetical protein